MANARNEEGECIDALLILMKSKALDLFVMGTLGAIA
jgi:hypothetical protein